MKKIRRTKIRVITEQLLVVRSGAAEESANGPGAPAVCPLCHSSLVSPILSPAEANQKNLPAAASKCPEDDREHQCSDTE